MFIKIEKVKVKGKEEEKVDFFVNSFSDYVILPPEIIKRVKPKIFSMGLKFEKFLVKVSTRNIFHKFAFNFK